MVDTCKGDLKKKLQTVKGGSVSVIVEEASCRRRGSFSVLVWEMFSGESFPCRFSRIFWERSKPLEILGRGGDILRER